MSSFLVHLDPCHISLSNSSVFCPLRSFFTIESVTPISANQKSDILGYCFSLSFHLKYDKPWNSRCSSLFLEYLLLSFEWKRATSVQSHINSWYRVRYWFPIFWQWYLWLYLLTYFWVACQILMSLWSPLRSYLLSFLYWHWLTWIPPERVQPLWIYEWIGIGLVDCFVVTSFTQVGQRVPRTTYNSPSPSCNRICDCRSRIGEDRSCSLPAPSDTRSPHVRHANDKAKSTDQVAVEGDPVLLPTR